MGYLPQGHGFIEVVTGPMFADKTTTFLRAIERATIGGKVAMVFKPDVDTRDEEDVIGTHNGDGLYATTIPVNNPRLILEEVDKYPAADPIGIDEGQFFSDDLVDVVEILANAGKRVIITGVDMDYRCLPWSPMDKLMAVAEIVHKQTAVCEQCGKPASKIQRFTNGKLSRWDEPTVVIGDKEPKEHEELKVKHSYEPRCRDCWRTPPKIVR